MHDKSTQVTNECAVVCVAVWRIMTAAAATVAAAECKLLLQNVFVS
jgi:hypothetical protein